MAPLSQHINEGTTGDAVVDQGAAGSTDWPVKNDLQTALLQQLVAEIRKTNMLLCMMAGIDYSQIDATTLLPSTIYD